MWCGAWRDAMRRGRDATEARMAGTCVAGVRVAGACADEMYTAETFADGLLHFSSRKSPKYAVRRLAAV